MDPRLGFESLRAYMGDDAAAAHRQSLLRSSSGGGGLPSSASQMTFAAPAGASFQPDHSSSLGGYFERELGRQEISSSVAGMLPFDAATAASSYSAPVPLLSLSNGQGYYTVESLEGKVAGDIFGSQTSSFYGGERNLEIGQQGFESGALPTALQNGIGKIASVPPLGVGASLPYLSSHLPQEWGLGGTGSLVHGDGGVPSSYLHHAQGGLLPGRMTYEQLAPLTSLGPAFAGGPQDWEWRYRNDLLLAALKQKRDLDRKALMDRMDREAHMDRIDREALMDRRDREALMDRRDRDAHMERRDRDREARRAFSRERSLERHERLPFVRRHQGLSSSFKRKGPGVSKTWCSVCQLECDTTFNFKTHLGGKRHKLKLDEEALKEDGKSLEREETIMPKSKKAEHDADETIQLSEGEGEEKVKVTGDHVISDEKEVPNNQGSEDSSLGKRSYADGTVRHPNKKLKQNNGEKVTGNQFMFKKGSAGNTQRCELCDVTCFSKGDLRAHFKGKRHAAQVQFKKSKQGAGVETARAVEVDSEPNQSEEVV